MTNEYETIKEWVGNNFMFNLPDAIYNLDACLRSRLHITFKGISGIYIIHLRSWKYEDCIPEGYVPPKSMKR